MLLLLASGQAPLRGIAAPGFRMPSDFRPRNPAHARRLVAQAPPARPLSSRAWEIVRLLAAAVGLLSGIVGYSLVHPPLAPVVLPAEQPGRLPSP
ncbi:MAG: hypothetical protein VKP62_05215 [Candidatus Sericytochromatia bacterium]|nr:hypothetical protein [Candidatus Sericytochromatia bacterium]